MPDTAMPKPASGLRELAGRYDLFLLDQYGVLHDGRAPYAGVMEALKGLRRHGKQVCVLTNSGRSARHNLKRLGRLGFEPALFDHVATSGDMALEWLLRERPGTPCYPYCTPAVAACLRQAGLVLAESPEEAGLILLSTLPLPPDRMTEDTAAPVFEAGLRRGLTLVCANPDMVGPEGDRIVISPGTVAAWYRARGGSVRYFGKPDPAFVHHALSLFPGAASARSVMIGDTPETDLAGARAAGIDAVFITGGVHAEAFTPDAPGRRQEIAAGILRAAAARADWVMPGLTW